MAASVGFIATNLTIRARLKAGQAATVFLGSRAVALIWVLCACLIASRQSGVDLGLFRTTALIAC